MPQGPGKYDDLATYVREQAEAMAALVIVLAGNKGSGFSLQALQSSKEAVSPIVVAELLRAVANEIEASVR